MRFSAIVLLLLAWQVPAEAQTGPQGPLTIEQAVQEAIDHNLTLVAERYNVSVAEARVLTARLRPNPVLTAGADYLDWLGAGFTPAAGIGPAEWNVRADYPIERGGKRERRMDVAENARAVAELQLLNTVRLLMLDAQNACVEVLQAKESVALASENLAAFEGTVKVNVARVGAGDLAAVELARTRVAALQFRNAVLQAESRLRQARSRLQVLLGRTVPLPDFDVVGELRRETLSSPLPDLQRIALELRPDLRALVRDQARSVADLRLQEALGKVDLSVGAMLHHQFGPAVLQPGSSLGFFLSVPLPLFNRNQGEIERARRESTQIEARIRALQNDIRQEVQSAYQQYAVARQLLESIETGMLQEARQVRQTTEYSYRRGEASFVELLDAQRAFNDTVQSYNEARADYARSLYLLDSASGKGVNP